MNTSESNHHNDSQQIVFFQELRKTKSQELRAQIIRDNLHLVIPIARKFRQDNVGQEDLIQVGYIGLIKAVDNFDPDRGIKFITYATHCIMGEIRHFIRDKSDSIKKPRWLKRLSCEMAAFVETFLQHEKRLPSIDEIASALNIEGDGIIEILKSKNLVNLNDFQEGTSETLMLNKIRSKQLEDFKLPIEDRIVLEQAIESLRKLEKRVIHLFFYKDLTQTQIAFNLGLSQKKVSRMLKKSLDKLRDFLTFGEGNF